MKSSSASASAEKNEEVSSPEFLHSSSRRRRASSRRIDNASNPGFTRRRVHHERCTAAVNRSPAPCANASRPARPRSKRANGWGPWFITLDGDVREEFVTPRKPPREVKPNFLRLFL